MYYPARSPRGHAFEHRPRGSQRCEFLRARMERADDGSLAVSTHSHRGSGVLTSTGWANGLAVICEGRSVGYGNSVEFLPFSELLS
jgi:molybdopterin molybdotransferase